MPAIRVFFVPRDHVELTDGWDVLGLVGTGSWDYTVPEQVVDRAFTFDLLGDRPQRGGPVYRFGVLGLALIGHAAFGAASAFGPSTPDRRPSAGAGSAWGRPGRSPTRSGSSTNSAGGTRR